MRRALLAALLGCAVAAPSMAAVVYSTGFEPNEVSPGVYSPGDLVGQDGWDRFDTESLHVPPDPTPNVPITVQTSTFKSGSQAVQIQNLAGVSSESTFAFRDFSVINPVSDGTPLVTVQWDMRVASGGIQNSHDWGVQMFDDNAATNLVAGAGLGVQPGGGGGTTLVGFSSDVNANTQSSTDFGPGAPLDEFHTYTLTLDYAQHLYAIDLDGVRRALAPFDSSITTLGEVDFFENNRATDSAFFDNLSITTGTGLVPEPASLGLLGLAGGMLMGRRRKA
jgi:hypothetical protein